MDCHWDNSCVLEFIDLLQSEPTIWDTKRKSHKNRVAVNDAWERIKIAFSLQCTVEDLKRKRNSLMTAYREHLKRIKDASNTDSGIDDVYKPTWFAFETMHSFLGPVYEYQAAMNMEEQTSSPSQLQENDSCVTCKRKNTTKDLVQAKKPTDDPFTIVKDRKVHKYMDENDLFAQILVRKLKKMDEEDRLILTHEINNLVFKYEMKARSRLKKKSTSSCTSNTYVPSPSSDLEIKAEIPDDLQELSSDRSSTNIENKFIQCSHSNGI